MGESYKYIEWKISDTEKYVPHGSMYIKFEYNKLIYGLRSQNKHLRGSDWKGGMRASSGCCTWSVSRFWHWWHEGMQFVQVHNALCIL